MGSLILFLGIFLSVLLRAFFILHGAEVADISKLREMGEAVLNGINPYLSIPYNVYPPLAIYIEAGTLSLSYFFDIPFHILTKILPNLADILTTFLIYKFLIKTRVKPIFACFWSLAFVLNPISIIISSAHGQIDSIPSLLVLFAIYVMVFYSHKLHNLAAISLGLAITIKPNPLMLLPSFYLLKNQSLKQKVTFLLICILPIAVMITPYTKSGNLKILEGLFGYSGVYDLGYAAVFRGISYQDNANFWLPQSQKLSETSKLIFFTGLILLSMFFLRGRNLVRSCLSIYLLFLTVYFGISAQYLSWILSLAIIAREKMIIYFSFTGLFALLGFYMFFGPEIIFGKLLNLAAYQSKYISMYFFGNLIFWITTLWWFIKIVKKND